MKPDPKDALPVVEVVGIVPAAGRARRLVGLTGSKEVLPIGPSAGDQGRPVASLLLDRFRLAGIRAAVVVLRRGKWDIPETLGDGSRWGVDLCYRVVEDSRSVPHTLDSAYPMLRGKVVALGFPDILFEPADAFAPCLERLRVGTAAIVLGLFPTEQPEKTDMVELDQAGNPTRFVIKSPDCGLRFTWSIAVWTPTATELLHRWLGEKDGGTAGDTAGRTADRRELYVGDFFSWLLDQGIAIEGVRFESGSYLDVGTREDLAKARRETLPRADPRD